jgi:hypothetical protein
MSYLVLKVVFLRGVRGDRSRIVPVLVTITKKIVPVPVMMKVTAKTNHVAMIVPVPAITMAAVSRATVNVVVIAPVIASIVMVVMNVRKVRKVERALSVVKQKNDCYRGEDEGVFRVAVIDCDLCEIQRLEVLLCVC